jgi:Protein of unknown function (DUF1236)
MRAIVLSVAVFFGLGSLSYGQNQPQTLKGVYGPPGSSALGPSGSSGSSALGASGKSSLTLSPPNLDAVGSGPRVLLPGKPVQGETLPEDVTPTPIPGRPGYGAVVVNGRRVIVDLNTNRIFQVLD